MIGSLEWFVLTATAMFVIYSGLRVIKLVPTTWNFINRKKIKLLFWTKRIALLWLLNPYQRNLFFEPKSLVDSYGDTLKVWSVRNRIRVGSVSNTDWLFRKRKFYIFSVVQQKCKFGIYPKSAPPPNLWCYSSVIDVGKANLKLLF